MPPESAAADIFSGRNIPELYLIIPAAGDKLPSIWTEGYLADIIIVLSKNCSRTAARGVPYTDCLVAASADKRAAVRAEGDAVDVLAVTDKCGFWLRRGIHVARC